MVDAPAHGLNGLRPGNPPIPDSRSPLPGPESPDSGDGVFGRDLRGRAIARRLFPGNAPWSDLMPKEAASAASLRPCGSVGTLFPPRADPTPCPTRSTIREPSPK